MTTSRKTTRAKTVTSREEDTMMLQCIQALFDMQGTGLKAPESLNDCADKSKLAKAVAQYQAENGGSILAAMGAVWFKKAAEMLMESELAAHLGYNKYERLPNQSNDTPDEIASDAPSDVSEGNGRRKGARNYRNGSYPRKMHTSGGTIEVDCPRDRKGTFASAVFPKGVKDVTGLQEKLLSLVAQGNDLRSAARIVEELMGVKVSHEYVHMTVENFGENDNPNFVGGDALAINIDVTQEETPEQPEQPQIGFDVSVILTFQNHDENVTIPITPGTGDSGDDDDDPNQGGGGQDPDPEPSKAITISDNGTGYLTNGVTVVGTDYPTDVAVVMNVPNGIKNVYVKIDSTDDTFKGMVADMGLVDGDGMDLASDEASSLGTLFALPEANATEYTFTMSSNLFVMLGAFSGKHDFSLTVIDAEDNQASATLTINN